MKLSDFSVRNSLFVNLLSAFLLISGIVVVLQLEREAFPHIDFDLVTIQTPYPGGTPQDVEKLITTPIEKELKRVNHLDEVHSISTENLSLIICEIDPDARNKNRVIHDVQRAVDRVTDLPEDAEDAIVTEITSEERPIIVVSLSGEVTESELQRQAEALEDWIEDLPDVARVERQGWRDREIWVEISAKKLAAYHLSLDEVMAALRSKNLNLSGGKTEIGKTEFLIRTLGEFESAEEVENVILRANELGNWIRVKDVGRAFDAFEETDILNKTLGTRAIHLTVIKKEKGDAIRLVDQVKETLRRFEKSAPPQLNISLFDDLSFFIRRRLRILTSNGLIGMCLVVGSLIFFLSRSVAFVTALAIPIAFCTVFVVMGAMGISINLISMFAMILVLGMLVDDSIVVSENTFRYMEMGVPPKEAAVRGAQEVTAPVTATILTTCAAFFSLFFMTGIMGKYVRTIPVVVIVALLASLMEALIILPSHLADFVRPMRREERRAERRRVEHRFFRHLLRHYTRTLRRVLQYRYITLGILALIFIGAALLAMRMDFILFKPGGIEIFFVRGETPVGTKLEETEKRFEPVERLIDTLPKNELDTYVTQIGIQRRDPTDPYTQRGSHLGQITVYLTPEQRRRRNAQEIVESLREKAKGIEGFTELRFDWVKPGPPVGRPVEVKLRGEHFETLTKISGEFQSYLRTLPGVRDVTDDYEQGKEEIRVLVDEEMAMRSGLSIERIANTVRFAFDGGVATKIKRAKAEEEIEVVVKLPEEERENAEVMKTLLIQNNAGRLVPLGKVAAFQRGGGVSFIKHLDGKRLVTVYADVDEKVTTSVTVNRNLMKTFRETDSRYPGYAVRYGGEQEETQKSLKSLFRAFLLTFFLIFMILACVFQSVIQPLIVMIAIPFGLVGVILTFFLHREPLGFMALLGTIGLTGVVVNDSIILVNFINQVRRAGVTGHRALIKAGRVRLRPVILTTVTTFFGLMPVAYGIGGSDPFLKPMALTVSWGLVFATFLTLLVIPCLYAVMDDVTHLRDRLTRPRC